mmetsp:Transcript_52062/g.116921  ORF Transcript_52062/g.116921 Transcript_52062/m.116921 type:complete len:208 (+) Transcript_52062:156-779(+)
MTTETMAMSAETQTETKTETRTKTRTKMTKRASCSARVSRSCRGAERLRKPAARKVLRHMHPRVQPLEEQRPVAESGPEMSPPRSSPPPLLPHVLVGSQIPRHCSSRSWASSTFGRLGCSSRRGRPSSVEEAATASSRQPPRRRDRPPSAQLAQRDQRGSAISGGSWRVDAWRLPPRASPPTTAEAPRHCQRRRSCCRRPESQPRWR